MPFQNLLLRAFKYVFMGFLTLPLLSSLPGCGSGTSTAASPPPAASATPTPTASSAATISSSADIQPIWEANCAPCHVGGSSGGLTLDSNVSYNELLAAGGQSTNNGPLVIVGDATNSKLIQKLEGAPFGSRMPQGGTPLSATVMDKIKQWINAGATNN